MTNDEGRPNAQMTEDAGVNCFVIRISPAAP
jgi:hypothetical protein